MKREEFKLYAAALRAKTATFKELKSEHGALHDVTSSLLQAESALQPRAGEFAERSMGGEGEQRAVAAARSDIRIENAAEELGAGPLTDLAKVVVKILAVSGALARSYTYVYTSLGMEYRCLIHARACICALLTCTPHIRAGYQTTKGEISTLRYSTALCAVGRGPARGEGARARMHMAMSPFLRTYASLNIDTHAQMYMHTVVYAMYQLG